jgi:hypothetical protein
MQPITVSITTFGLKYDHSFVASSILATLQEQLDEVKAALEHETLWPASIKMSPHKLIATRAKLDFKRLTELVNEPSTKPVLVVKLPSGWLSPAFAYNYYILDGHHRAASARLRGVDVEAVVVG